jgi:hypothetical protein
MLTSVIESSKLARNRSEIFIFLNAGLSCERFFTSRGFIDLSKLNGYD